MSHFFTAVILPYGTDPDDECIEDMVAEALSPFDENDEVEGYDRPCYCVGAAASIDSRVAADVAVGSLDGFRTRYWDEVRAGLRTESDDDWQVFMAPWREAREAVLAADPRKDKANPECDECHGSGVAQSTYNPLTYEVTYCLGDVNERCEVGSTGGHEVLPSMPTDVTRGEVLQGQPRQAGDPLHMVPGVRQSKKQIPDTSTKTPLASQTEIRPEFGGLRYSMGESAGEMRHLSKTTEDEGSRTARGPRPQDGESTRAFMLEVQSQLGPVGGRLRMAHCGCKVPHEPHITSRTLIGGSKWDWFVIGGRWDGAIRLQPAESEDGGFNFDDSHHGLKRNLVVVHKHLVKAAPFAVLTPEGDWFEKGEMGWWGFVSDEKEPDDWTTMLKQLENTYKGHLMVGCDLHI